MIPCALGHWYWPNHVPCLGDSNTYTLHPFISREMCLTSVHIQVYNTLQQCTILDLSLSDELKWFLKDDNGHNCELSSKP